jgi:hypothetical protein
VGERSSGGVAHAVTDGIARAASAPAVLTGTLVLTIVLALPPSVWSPWDLVVFAFDQYLAIGLLSPFGIVPHWSQGSGLSWLVVWSFLAGGILDRYARNRPTRGRGFFGACGAHLPAMLRLGVAEWLIWRAATALDPGSIRGSVPAILGVAAGLVFLYARVRLVVEDRRSALGAVLAAGRFIRRNPAAVPMFLVCVVAVGILDLLWQRTVLDLREGGWLAFAAAEVAITLLLFVVFASWAAATSLFQARLAHASYTAGPPLVWPESPAAEAITNLTPTRPS